MSEVRGSEQIAFERYSQLRGPDRRLVDAWRALGCDWVESLLNSGCAGSAWRRHPRDAETASVFARRARYGSAEWQRRRAAEHEAAHAVVALRLGLEVSKVGIGDDGSGFTLHTPAADRVDSVAVTIAPEVWFDRHRREEFPNGDVGGCTSDRRSLLYTGVHDLDLRAARRRAHDLLTIHRAEVLALAGQLEDRGAVDLSDGA